MSILRVWFPNWSLDLAHDAALGIYLCRQHVSSLVYLTEPHFAELQYLKYKANVVSAETLYVALQNHGFTSQLCEWVCVP